MTDELRPVEPADPLDLLERVLETQEALAGRVAALEQQLAAVDDEAEPPILSGWVAWLIRTYSLQAVLDGWQEDPAIELELTALMKAHASLKPRGFDDVVWHGHLASMVQRIAALRERTAQPEQDLNEWVAWLIPTYELQDVLDGWQSHPAMVRELAALMKAHIDVIGKHKGFDDVVWHGHVGSMVHRIMALRQRAAREQPHDAEQDLDEWVAWLIPTYALETVLDGWRAHPAMVRELAALMKAHIDVIGKPKGFDDVVWHGHVGSMVQRVQAFRERTTQDRQKAATQGGALASIKSRSNGAATVPIPTESH